MAKMNKYKMLFLLNFFSAGLFTLLTCLGFGDFTTLVILNLFAAWFLVYTKFYSVVGRAR